ncbi:MAG TPA: metallophosphoesterase, partial [Gemmatimonadaceae bacterium]|nr:metallophosphoesterase [Gemmatimonadaceae bacterium]
MPTPSPRPLEPHRSHRHAKRASRSIPASVATWHHDRHARRAEVPIRSMHEMTPAGFFIWLWGWIKATAFQWRKAPFPTHRQAPNNAIYTIPDECVIGIAADWGSGTAPALRVAEGIRSLAPDVTIHMGDVYFCGEPEEYERLFIGEPPGTDGSWPRGTTRPARPTDALPAYAMNGNHEMCGGGYGIFEHALPALGQKTSYFALENAYWRIVALDTGYTTPPNGVMQFFTDFLARISNGLPRANQEWLAQCVFRDPADKRPVVLLSHHQPLSAFEADYPVLRPQLAPFLDRVLLWFWGHEHRLAL